MKKIRADQLMFENLGYFCNIVCQRNSLIALFCAFIRNRDLQWWQAPETHMPPLLHLSNIASFLKFPSKHQWLPGKSSSILQQLNIIWTAIIQQTDNWGSGNLWIYSPIKISNPVRYKLALIKSVKLFQNTNTSVRLSNHFMHWGLIRATRCSRTLYLSTFYILPPLEVLLVGF